MYKGKATLEALGLSQLAGRRAPGRGPGTLPGTLQCTGLLPVNDGLASNVSSAMEEKPATMIHTAGVTDS